jgi:hypothetical protein
MKKIRKRSASWLAKSARRGFRGYPIATVALYGPTADLATKIAVSIIPDERNSPDQLERWFSEGINYAATRLSASRFRPSFASIRLVPWS